MKRKKEKLVIFAVIPAFNESKKIYHVVTNIKKYVNKVIIIDDGSTDDTFQKAAATKAIVLRHTINLGQGAAIQTGLELAKKLKADVVITFDADGQFSPNDIPNLVQPILDRKADIVLGSRFLGKAINIPISKKITLKLGIVFTNIFSNVSLTDTHNGFRAINKKAIECINITQNRMAHASEIIDMIKKNKLKFVEKPVTITYDNYSKSKGQKISNAPNVIFDLLIKKII